MNRSTILPAKVLTTIALTICLLAPGWAETIYDAASTGTGSNGSVHHPLTGTLEVSMGVNNYDNIETADPQNPMNGASGTCFGLIEMRDGVWSGQGYCAMDDATGDRYVISWTPNGPPVEYSWTLIGGSGKWEGATGSGQVTQTYHNDNQDFVSTFIGEITLK